MSADFIPTAFVAHMRVGTRFVDTHGDVWKRGTQHGSHNDVWLATRERDGYESCFAGRAVFEVIP